MQPMARVWRNAGDFSFLRAFNTSARSWGGDDAASFAQIRKGVVNAPSIDGGVRCVGNDDFWRDGCPQSVHPCVGGVPDAGEWQGVFFFERGNCGWGGEPIGEYADEFEFFRGVFCVQFFEC